MDMAGGSNDGCEGVGRFGGGAAREICGGLLRGPQREKGVSVSSTLVLTSAFELRADPELDHFLESIKYRPFYLLPFQGTNGERKNICF